MKKVLFITYLFPPQGGVGVQRAIKFIKYLPEFGWLPIVLTTKNIAKLNLDESLLEDIPVQIKVYKTSCFEPQNYKDDLSIKNFSYISLRDKLIRNFFRFFDFIFIPDEQILWIITAVLTGIRIILKEKIDIIFATGDPFTVFLIGYLLKKTTGRPLILDFRDEWISGYFLKIYQRKYKWQKKLEVKLEKKLVNSADKIISVTPSIIQNFKNNYPKIKERFHLIPNGYDGADFDFNVAPSKDKFIILHSGKLYKLRAPEVLFNSVEILCNNNSEFKENFKLVFMGEILQDVIPCLDEFKYKAQLELCGFKPHKESIKKLLESNVLCLILDKAPSSERVYTAKIFEYLASQRPILIFAKEASEVAKLVENSNLSYLVQNEVEGASVLEKLFLNWKEGKIEKIDNLEFIKEYTRKNLTGKLASLLDEIIKK